MALNRIACCIDIDAPFIDKTGIEGNIDFELDAVFTDMKDVKRGLQKIGLDLVPGVKEMKVVVIRDAGKE